MKFKLNRLIVIVAMGIIHSTVTTIGLLYAYEFKETEVENNNTIITQKNER